MLTFSPDTELANQQIEAILFYLTTFGYIDGHFDITEKQFVSDYIVRLVEHQLGACVPPPPPPVREELSARNIAHYQQTFEAIDKEIQELFSEAVATDEEQEDFVYGQLKLRCFEIFQSFDIESQEALMETIDELILADGEVHPAEVKFRAELAELLEADLGIELLEDDDDGPKIEMEEAEMLLHSAQAHPFFKPLEQHYALDPAKLERQVSADRQLIDRVIALLAAQRQKGQGRLSGVTNVGAFFGQAPFLDGHVYVHPLRPGRKFEITVLGDLHGCYSCLKATVLQSRFFERVDAFRKDPEGEPEPKLVLLGDYIDRGKFSYNGVLRASLEMFSRAPQHVYMLRGNHEYYVEMKGQVVGGVKPAEAIATMKPHLGTDVFRHYRSLFNAMPNVLLFGPMLFVHGGLAQDLVLRERYRDLSSLNDPKIRFQMMWSDPSTAEVIPPELQAQSARFSFGRAQCQAFLQRIGCRLLVRGHEKVDEGFKRSYNDDSFDCITLFSAGGRNNADIPENSSYRSVTPMALTIRVDGEQTRITPWVIDYEAYNDPMYNAFFESTPEIPHRLR